LTSIEGPQVSASVGSLLSASAVRERAQMIFARGLEGKLAHFAVHIERLPAAATYVAQTIRQNYPDLKVPPHARWRHFVVQGLDRSRAIYRAEWDNDRPARARVQFEIAITSVLLDAGAGPKWGWSIAVDDAHDLKLIRVGRSEGLALASLDAYKHGLFSTARFATLSDKASADKWRADAAALAALSVRDLADAFAVTDRNPLEGLEGRVALLNRLGTTISARPDLFGTGQRLGGLYDTLAARATGRTIAAPDILGLVLEALGPIWAGRLTIDGVPLGDTWRHPAIDVPGPTHGLMPIHKLSQWLAYSLIEPLEEAGIKVTDVDGLTGLAEYRNGGLFLDLGVLAPRDPALLQCQLAPADEPIVEWRALTVALLDEIAPLVRAELGVTATQMPLASILEGGTWSAGRRIAKEKRADGGPPLNIVSDGSVF
jgi:hypothetical protein